MTILLAHDAFWYSGRRPCDRASSGPGTARTAVPGELEVAVPPGPDPARVNLGARREIRGRPRARPASGVVSSAGYPGTYAGGMRVVIAGGHGKVALLLE